MITKQPPVRSWKSDLDFRTRELEVALDHQAATSEILKVIRRSPADFQSVLDQISETAARLCDADYTAFFRLRHGKYHVGSSNRIDSGFVKVLSANPVAPGRNTCVGRAALERQVIHIADWMTDAELRNPATLESAQTTGIRTVIGVPIIEGGDTQAVIFLARTSIKEFSDRQISLMQTLGEQAMIALENARLFEEVQDKSRQLERQSAELAELNHTLEVRVAEQVDQLGRMSKLRRFLSPKISSLIMSGEVDDPLKTRRAEITVVYVDLRGFTAFTETTDPEEVMAVLRQYHAELGKAITAHDGTIEHFAGDGAMILFNAPMPTENHELQAIRMTLQIRESVGALTASWRKLGFSLGFGAGIAGGYATMGTIGFAERLDYSAIGNVCNLSARLCSEAIDGQILISPRVFVKVENQVEAEPMGELTLKGFHRPVAVHNLLGLRAKEAI